MKIAYLDADALKELLDSMTDEEADQLMRVMDDPTSLSAFMHGWSACAGFFQMHPPVALWISQPGGNQQEFLVDLTMAVGLLVLRSGHDPTEPPPRELVDQVQDLVDVTPAPDPRSN